MGSPLQVAVFPLPKIVAFPGHSLQFHIFEPRYRRMVRDCQEKGIWLGVAQGDLFRKARVGQTLEEFLNSNQEMYSPVEVFGVGPMRVLKELPDGRFVIEVDIQERVRARERVQELPYMLVEAEPLPDDCVDEEEEDRLLSELKTEIGRIASLRTGLLKHLQSKEYFDDTSLTTLVYSILKWFVIENREGQTILEDNSPVGRAEKLLSWMRYFVREASVHAARPEAKTPPRGRKARDPNESGETHERANTGNDTVAEGEAALKTRRRSNGMDASGSKQSRPTPPPTTPGDGHVLHVDFHHKKSSLETE